MKPKSVLIVGGGIVGLCTAYYALEKGHSVTIVERGGQDHDSCSLGNAGMVVPSHFVPLAGPGMVEMGLKVMWQPDSPFYIRPRFDLSLVQWCLRFMRSANAGHVEHSAPLLRDLDVASVCAYEDLAEEFGSPFELVRRGLLMLCKTDAVLEEEGHLAEKANSLGVPAEVLDARAAADRDPGLTMDIAGAVYFPNDAHLTPTKLVALLTEQVAARGGKFVWNADVSSFEIRGGRIYAAKTSQGTMTADEFVLAAGSWSPTLVRSLGIRIPMQAGKGYSVTLDAPKQKPRLCSILTEARVAVTPMGDTLRFGGTMEVTGLDESISPTRLRGILEAVPRYFPQFGPDDFRDLPVWKGLRPCSPDGLPYIGRCDRWTNLIAATGHSMMGVSLGPITGKLVTSLLCEETPTINIDALRPQRFG